MYSRLHLCARAVLIALLATGLAACGNMSTGVAEDGSGTEQLTSPAPTATNPLHKGSTHPTLANLRRIHAGMSKSQIIALIGPPQFNEGFWQVRESDHLSTPPKGDDTAVCQYKILFNSSMIAQSFQWKPAVCAKLLNPPVVVAKPAPKPQPVPKPQPAPQPAPQPPQAFTLSADALFAFDSATLQPAGRQALDRIASEIVGKANRIHGIRITGYTDNIGPTAYNLYLSQLRARAVLQYLQQGGVPSGLMTAVGRGEADPVATTCAAIRNITAHLACLAPDRRVTIEVFGQR